VIGFNNVQIVSLQSADDTAIVGSILYQLTKTGPWK
jgi:hypothetical protein